MILRSLSIALGAALLAAAPSTAATPDDLTFRGLEHRYSGAERVAVAQEHFGTRITSATPIHEARATLERAGAHCHAGATLTCTHNSFDAGADNNMLRQIVWTVEAQHQNGTVTNLAIERDSIGS